MKTNLGSITRPRGFSAAGGTCGIKVSGAPDLAMIVCDRPAVTAAVFTTNAVVGAPVTIGRRHVRRGRLRAIVCNSGCANVATGQRGLDNAIRMCKAVAEQVGCQPHEVLPTSTGVIGHQLPISKIAAGIADIATTLSRGDAADAAAATAIMTTDTRPKAAHRALRLGKATIHVGGIAKGSGMIAPNMATMLVFITTDADIAAGALRRALRDAVNADASLNRISVDTDTSTSDTVAVLASGLAGNDRITSTAAPGYAKFAAALCDLCRDLAYQVISDGEGAEHVIRVTVDGAKSQPDALRVARAVADSPLVKCAVHGADPNWGRIAAAAGRSGAKVDSERLVIRIGKTAVYRKSGPAKFSEAALSRVMKQPEVHIRVDLGLGKGHAEVLGCDLSREYVAINADYHT
jgi:glutamate N-acetyltransferase/amino-acid N-acetyltransferase